ncbi:hypothetical protein ACN08P_11295 [Photobacterium leiognathi subsp. mandapamensis]|uniref:hypothetical protein n=1 Tax=Photobacterium leiognathi TaxID=553611 RepID=UPI003AF406F9
MSKEERAKQYRRSQRNKKMQLVPKNITEFPFFGQSNRPRGYKTMSQLKVTELHLYEFAGTCCSTYGDLGYLFKPKSDGVLND